MRIHHTLVRLYPQAFRERWGEQALADETRAAGWRAWPGLLLGIADIWLHPALWPADSRLERRERAATLAVTAALTSAALGHFAAEQGAPLAALPGSRLPGTGSLLLLLAGLALVAPVPRLTLAAVAVLARAARRLALPAALAAAAIAAAHLGAPRLADTPWRFAVLGLWWGAVALGTVRICRTIGALTTPVIFAPRRARLRLGLALLSAGATLAGAQVLRSALCSAHPDLLTAAAGAGLLLPAWALAATLHDLRTLPAG
ncbi:hypothetical protein [Kitasatospora sp. LaBMicrA B282]|uniref:hypothetical protein n=1 Tax=Kitasatospora sp. LaBMicrA B282 TaxID=3420949 RepID=UPI003D0FD256